MLSKGDLLTLSDNKEYIVANLTNLDDNTYVYLVTKDGMEDFKILKLDKINKELITVKDLNIIERLLMLFSKR